MSVPAKAVFLSYASQDADAAARLCAALREAGSEVWFDKSELRGGDAWDASIRRQIKTCSLLIPIISATTEARSEGYFRREWKLAVDRMLDMADDHPFLLPVVIDATPESAIRVPDAFRDRQWTRCIDGEPPVEFVERVRQLLGAPELPAPAPKLVPQGVASHPGPRRNGKAAWLGGAVVAIAVIAALFFWKWPALKGGSDTAAIDKRMTFAVLPIGAPNGDKDAQAFANEVSEGVLRRQTESPWSRVASRESTADALRRHSAPKDIGNALNVHFIIRGTVAREAGFYRTVLALTDTETDRALGTQEFKWPLGKPLNIHTTEVDDAIGRLAAYGYRVELEKTRKKKDEDLDAKDLIYLANVTWKHDEATYKVAMGYLQRAMALSPDDRLGLLIMARINLCECRNSWAKNPKEIEQIGSDAVDRYLSRYPPDRPMLQQKAALHEIHGRYDDSFVINERLLEVTPDDSELLFQKAYLLNKLGKPDEALRVVTEVLKTNTSPYYRAGAAAINYRVGHYADAADLAQRAIAEYNKAELAHPMSGGILLIRAAAESRLGHEVKAKAAVAEFQALVPEGKSVSAIRKWQDSRADLTEYDPLYADLHKIGIPE